MCSCNVGGGVSYTKAGSNSQKEEVGGRDTLFFFFIDYFRVRMVGSICYEKDEK